MILLFWASLGFNRHDSFSQSVLSNLDPEVYTTETVVSSVLVDDLPRESTELKTQPQAHPVASMFLRNGVTHSTNTDRYLDVNAKRVLKTKLSETDVLSPMPNNEGSDDRYFHHPGVCTMMDMDYQNWDDRKSGTWYGIPMCGPAFGRRVRHALSFDEAVTTEAKPDDKNFYQHQVHKPISTQFGQVTKASVMAWSPVGCLGTDLQTSPDCALDPSLHYVETGFINVSTSGSETGIEISASRKELVGTGTLPLREHALPANLKKEQMECKTPNGTYIDVDVPDQLLYNPCKACTSDAECPGGYHCIVSAYLGLTLINGHEEECVEVQRMTFDPGVPFRSCVPVNAPLLDLLHCGAEQKTSTVIQNMIEFGYLQLLIPPLMETDIRKRMTWRAAAKFPIDPSRYSSGEQAIVNLDRGRQSSENSAQFVKDSYGRVAGSAHGFLVPTFEQGGQLGDNDVYGWQNTIRRDLTRHYHTDRYFLPCILGDDTADTQHDGRGYFGFNENKAQIHVRSFQAGDDQETPATIYEFQGRDVTGSEPKDNIGTWPHFKDDVNYKCTIGTGLVDKSTTCQPLNHDRKQYSYGFYKDGTTNVLKGFLGANFTAEYCDGHTIDNSDFIPTENGDDFIDILKDILSRSSDPDNANRAADWTLWNMLLQHFVNSLFFEPTHGTTVCSKRFKCSDHSVAHCPAEPTCRVIDGHCERITEFSHDELCNFAMDGSSTNPTVFDWFNKCCVYEIDTHVDPFADDTLIRRGNPESTGSETCTDAFGTPGSVVDVDGVFQMCDVSKVGERTYSLVRANVIPRWLVKAAGSGGIDPPNHQSLLFSSTQFFTSYQKYFVEVSAFDVSDTNYKNALKSVKACGDFWYRNENGRGVGNTIQAAEERHVIEQKHGKSPFVFGKDKLCLPLRCLLAGQYYGHDDSNYKENGYSCVQGIQARRPTKLTSQNVMFKRNFLMPSEFTVHNSDTTKFNGFWLYNESFLHDPRFSVYMRNTDVEGQIGPHVVRHVNTPKAHCCLWQPLDDNSIHGGIPSVNDRPPYIGCIESAEELFNYWSTAPPEAFTRCKRSSGDLRQTHAKLGVDAKLSAAPNMPALGHTDKIQLTTEFQSLYTTLPIPDDEQFFNGYRGLQFTPECFADQRSVVTALMIPIEIPERKNIDVTLPDGENIASVFIVFVGINVNITSECKFTTTSADNNNNKLTVRYRSIQAALPPRLRGLEDPSNPCLLEPATYAAFARTSSSGNSHVDGITITHANFLQLYGLNGVYGSVYRAGAEFTDNSGTWNRFIYTGNAEKSKVNEFNPFLQESMELNYTKYISFGTSPETLVNGPYHNPEITHDALFEILKSPMHTVGESPDFTTMLDYLKTNKPFRERYNNEFITISFEMVRRPVVALGCRIETALLSPMDADVGESSGDTKDVDVDETFLKRHCLPVGQERFYASNFLTNHHVQKSLPPRMDYRNERATDIILREGHCLSAILSKDGSVNVAPLSGIDAGVFQQIVTNVSGTLTDTSYGCINYEGQGQYRYRNNVVITAANLRSVDDTEWVKGLNFNTGAGHGNNLGSYNGQNLLVELWNGLSDNERFDPTDPGASLDDISIDPFPEREHFVWRKSFIVQHCHGNTRPCYHILPDQMQQKQESTLPSLYYSKDLSTDLQEIPESSLLYFELRRNFIEYRDTVPINQAHPFIQTGGYTNCVAEFGKNVGDSKCCGQPGTINADQVDKICPEEFPICVGYVPGERWGVCIKSELCRPTWATYLKSGSWSLDSTRTNDEFDFTVDSIALQTVVRSHTSVPLNYHRVRGHPNSLIRGQGLIKRRLPIVMGLPSPWSNEQLVPKDYTLRPYTASQSESGAAGKSLCRCGGNSPEYACIVYGPEYYIQEMAVNGLLVPELNQRISTVNVRVCAWSWGGLGIPGVAGAVGLFIGSDYTGVDVVERDILGDASSSTETFKNTFAKQFAPDKDALLDAIGYTRAGEPERFTDPRLATRYTLSSGCARQPYGRWHSASLTADLREKMFIRPRSTDGFYKVGQEAMLTYCETGNDGKFTACADDPFSYSERKAWCDSHPNNSKVTVAFIPGLLEEPCFKLADGTQSVCILYGNDLRFDTLDKVLALTDSKPVTVIIAPFSAQVRDSLATATRQFDIEQPDGVKRRALDDALKNFDSLTPADEKSEIVSILPMQMALLVDPKLWADKTVDDIRNGLVAITNAILNDGKYNQSTYGHVDCKSEVFLPVHVSGTPTEEVGACMQAWHMRPTLTGRGGRIDRPDVTIVAANDQDIFVPPVTDTEIFGKSKGSCVATAITAPRVTLDSKLYVDQSECDGAGSASIGVVASGDNVNELAIKGVTVVGSARSAAIAFLGGDREFNAQARTLSMSDVRVGEAIAQNGQHAILLAHTTADPGTVSFPALVSIFIQESSAVDNFEVDCSKPCVWEHPNRTYDITNVTELTSVFGAPYERRYYHPPVNHNQALIAAVCVLLPVAIVLVVALGAIYYRGARNVQC